MTATKAVTNEDLLETIQLSMQTTSDMFEATSKEMREGFAQLNARIDRLEGEQRDLKSIVSQIELRLGRLEQEVKDISNEQPAQRNDIHEILDRLVAIERRLPNITGAETNDMQANLQALIDWALRVARVNHIPLTLPNHKE